MVNKLLDNCRFGEMVISNLHINYIFFVIILFLDTILSWMTLMMF